ncbi:TetR/AcrR family transcriptional regulator [Mycobacterium sp. 236(2023)]|uniref:TetR/AcrR family transcriptional regulator n=1 Tax=Mycobacterium sp. 236(2023) TaxID=3038163 RepID=UPI002414D848|nr:TetR/AcrR family transcriptional regulator [Mycobacterium sp. 236(2023)]MDG4664406.1 TetR/AcrR family transcriptional regulator [Mycobacterium sp. 236(2023)]
MAVSSDGTSVATGRDVRRGRPRDERLDDVIVSAAIAEVGAKGWTGATIEGIAARAGVGRATIYRRWSSKTELFHYAASSITQPVEVPETGSLSEDLFAAVLPIADMLARPDLDALLPALLVEAATDGSIRDTLRTFATRSRQQAVAAVERARQAGEIASSTDADALVQMVAGGLLYRRLLLGEAVDASAVRTLIGQATQSCSPSSKEGF